MDGGEDRKEVYEGALESPSERAGGWTYAASTASRFRTVDSAGKVFLSEIVYLNCTCWIHHFESS